MKCCSFMATLALCNGFRGSKWWFHPKIHNFGNNGLCGHVHAMIAPFATGFIDQKAYNGRNIRNEISKDAIGNARKNQEALTIVDFGCGVGMSTVCLLENSQEYDKVIGLDTSKEMLAHAKKPRRIRYARENIIVRPEWIDAGSVDLITCMFVMHEAPKYGHIDIINNAHTLLKPGGLMVVVDISPDYIPSQSMLTGEPFVNEYLETIEDTLTGYTKTGMFKSYHEQCCESFIEKHVIVCYLEKI